MYWWPMGECSLDHQVTENILFRVNIWFRFLTISSEFYGSLSLFLFQKVCTRKAEIIGFNLVHMPLLPWWLRQ